VLLTNELLQLVVRKLKKKDKLKGVGKWECEIGQDWSTCSSVEAEGILENASNVSVHYPQLFHCLNYSERHVVHEISFKALDLY